MPIIWSIFIDYLNRLSRELSLVLALRALKNARGHAQRAPGLQKALLTIPFLGRLNRGAPLIASRAFDGCALTHLCVRIIKLKRSGHPRYRNIGAAHSDGRLSRFCLRFLTHLPVFRQRGQGP